MLQAEGSALLLDLPQELSLGSRLPEVPVLLLVLPILEHAGKQLEQMKRAEPTAPAVSCAVTVQELGGVGIPVIGSSVQPTQREGEIPLDFLPDKIELSELVFRVVASVLCRKLEEPDRIRNTFTCFFRQINLRCEGCGKRILCLCRRLQTGQRRVKVPGKVLAAIEQLPVQITITCSS